jgi:hypothetical protein
LKRSYRPARILNSDIIEARDDIADDVSRIVKKCMESAMEEMVPEVPYYIL